jgi:hypothetical protein
MLICNGRLKSSMTFIWAVHVIVAAGDAGMTCDFDLATV